MVFVLLYFKKGGERTVARDAAGIGANEYFFNGLRHFGNDFASDFIVFNQADRRLRSEDGDIARLFFREKEAFDFDQVLQSDGRAREIDANGNAAIVTGELEQMDDF